MKNRIMSGIKSETLEIPLPEQYETLWGDVTLSNEMLHWQHDKIEKRKRFASKGCLEEFIQLAGASSTDIFAFTQRRGLLAIDPYIESQLSNYLYSEPVLFYTRLAEIFATIYKAASCLKTGLPFKNNGAWQLPKSALGQSSDAKQRLANDLYEAASKLKDSVRIFLMMTLQDGFPRLTFYYLTDGFGWSEARVKQVAAAGIPHSLLTADPEYDDIWVPVSEYSEVPLMPPTSVISYREYTERAASVFPKMQWPRPSPLLCVLVLQLMQEIAIPYGLYPCSHCGKNFLPRQGKNKPRTDRAMFCSDDCKVEYKQEYDRQRYNAKHSGGMETAQ